MRRRLLDRLLVGEVLGNFIFAVALFTTILVAMTELQQLTSMVVDHHVPVWTAVRIFALSLPRFISLAFPMATLLSTMLAFGRLSGEYEMTALMAAGVSPYRMAAPVACIGLTVSLLAFGFNEYVAPVATSRENEIYDAAIRMGVPTNRPFHYEAIKGDQRIFVLDAANYDSESKKLIRPTFLFFDAHDRPRAIMFAPTGVWDGGTTWTLYNGFSQPISDDPKADTTVVQFPAWTTRLGVSVQDLLMANQDPDAMSYRQLEARIRRKQRERHVAPDIDFDLVKLHSKFSIPFASMIFALIGFPLGVRRQRTASAIGFGISIGIIFVYYLIYQYATTLGSAGALAPWLGAWLANILAIGVAIVLLRRLSI